MASTVTVIWHFAGNQAFNRGIEMPVVRLPEARGELIAASGVSAKSLLFANQGASSLTKDGGFATVVAGANPIWVVSGPLAALTAVRPTAGPGNDKPGFPLAANESVTFAVDRNDGIAVIE